MFRRTTTATCLALLSSISSVASLPKLYDVGSGEGVIAPLDISKLDREVYWYGYELQGTAIPTEKGAPMTQYEMKEIVSQMEIPISGQAYAGSMVLTGPVTRTYTMDQGASTLHFSKATAMITTAAIPLRVSGVVRDCSLDLEKKEGVCVDQIQRPLLTTITEPATTVMSTYTTSITTTYTRPLNVLNFTNAALSQTVAPAALSAVIWVGAAVGMLLV